MFQTVMFIIESKKYLYCKKLKIMFPGCLLLKISTGKQVKSTFSKQEIEKLWNENKAKYLWNGNANIHKIKLPVFSGINMF